MKTQSAPAFNNSYLSWDVLLMGGISIIFCLGFWIFFDKSISVLTVSQTAATLAFIVNHPHFLSSYMLLYGDFRKKIKQSKRYFFAAIIAPGILAGVLISALMNKDQALMGHIITAMFFLVGWHYVKQIFGCVIVSSAQRKIYYKSWERRLMLTNLFSVWFMSFLGSHVVAGSFDFYGIVHHSLQLPPWTLQYTFWFVGFSAVLVAAMHVQKYVNEGTKPSAPAVTAYFALYAWYLPTLSHPGFAYLIPFFHSLQYLAFVWLLKKNQVGDQIKDLKDVEWRQAWVKNFGGFILGSLILGALFFEFIPKGIDGLDLGLKGTLGYAPILASFLLFINIHHYFIDNVIWRSDNEVVKKYLMQPQYNHSEQRTNKAA